MYTFELFIAMKIKLDNQRFTYRPFLHQSPYQNGMSVSLQNVPLDQKLNELSNTIRSVQYCCPFDWSVQFVIASFINDL